MLRACRTPLALGLELVDQLAKRSGYGTQVHVPPLEGTDDNAGPCGLLRTSVVEYQKNIAFAVLPRRLSLVSRIHNQRDIVDTRNPATPGAFPIFVFGFSIIGDIKIGVSL